MGSLEALLDRLAAAAASGDQTDIDCERMDGYMQGRLGCRRRRDAARKARMARCAFCMAACLDDDPLNIQNTTAGGGAPARAHGDQEHRHALALASRAIAAAKQLSVGAAPRAAAAQRTASATAALAPLQAVEAALRCAADALGTGDTASSRAGSTEDGTAGIRLELAGRLITLAVEGGGGSAAAAAMQPSQQQQQRAIEAALAALDALPPRAVAALPDAPLRAALLLRPALLDGWLEAAAAACCGGGADGGVQGENNGGRCSLAEALAAQPAASWWRRLPPVLAEQPALMARTATTLLAWWQAGGQHPRLWQLLSTLCAPAWRELLGGGEPAAAPQSSLPREHSSGRTLPSPECAALLLCGDRALLPLARLLLQTPSRAALRRVLAALRELGALHEVPEVALVGGGSSPAAADEHAAAGAAAAAVAAMDDDGEEEEEPAAAAAGPAPMDCDWPADDDWERVARGRPRQQQRRQQRQEQTQGGSRRALAAWRLVMQRRAWFEYAAWVLAHTSLELLSAGPPTASAAAAMAAAAPSPSPPEAAPTQTAARRGRGRGDAARDAAAAAALIAFVAAPADAAAQGRLCQQLLACAEPRAPSQQQQPEQQGQELDESAERAAPPAEALLVAWHRASETGAWPWWVAGVALPLALLQHPAVQLSGGGPALLASCLDGGSGNTPPAASTPSVARQLLRDVRHGQALDALGALSEAALELLQGEVRSALGTQQQQQPAGGAAAAKRSWLAACTRHALLSADAGGGEAAAAPSAPTQAPRAPLAGRLRLLLAAVQRCLAELEAASGPPAAAAAAVPS